MRPCLRAVSGAVEIAAEPANEPPPPAARREGFAARHADVRIAPLDAPSPGALTARAAVEALAVFVHKDNPLACLPPGNLAQLAAEQRGMGPPLARLDARSGIAACRPFRPAA